MGGREKQRVVLTTRPFILHNYRHSFAMHLTATWLETQTLSHGVSPHQTDLQLSCAPDAAVVPSPPAVIPWPGPHQLLLGGSGREGGREGGRGEGGSTL